MVSQPRESSADAGTIAVTFSPPSDHSISRIAIIVCFIPVYIHHVKIDIERPDGVLQLNSSSCLM